VAQEARPGTQQFGGRLDRVELATARIPQRDLAAIEAGQGDAEAEPAGEKGQVIDGGTGHGAGGPSVGRPLSDRSPMTVSTAGGDGTSGTMKTSLRSSGTGRDVSIGRRTRTRQAAQ